MLPRAAQTSLQTHTALEEGLHAGTHGLGIILAIVALVVLLVKAQGGLELTAVSIYGGCAIALYAASTVYHAAFKFSFQPFLEVIDHAAIYLKIAGSYTPFALLVLDTGTGIAILAIVWTAAVAGVVFKFIGHFHSGIAKKKYDWISLSSYVGLGWLGLFVAAQLFNGLSVTGFLWLVAGGLCFTIGAGFYAWKSRMYTHTIFHVFVLAGSVCHFVTVYGFVL